MNLHLFLVLTLLLLPKAAVPADTPLENHEGLSLKGTYEAYLRAVKAHDYDAVTSYFTKGGHLPFVSGGGKIILSYPEYLRGQKAWLEDSSWTYESELKSLQEFEGTGVVIESITLRFDKQGRQSEYKLVATYVFRKEDRLWRMVTDVCTEIQQEPPAPASRE